MAKNRAESAPTPASRIEVGLIAAVFPVLSCNVAREGSQPRAKRDRSQHMEVDSRVGAGTFREPINILNAFWA